MKASNKINSLKKRNNMFLQERITSCERQMIKISNLNVNIEKRLLLDAVFDGVSGTWRQNGVKYNSFLNSTVEDGKHLHFACLTCSV